jgi:putative cell wall-binding protein
MSAASRGRRASARSVLGLSLITVSLALVAPPAAADHVIPARMEGRTRFHTAADVALFTYRETGVAFVATGEDYPDALTASYAAGRTNHPILLVRTDDVPDVTWEALDALGVESVVIMGGPSAVSETVRAALEDRGYGTVRIAGSSRYETAADTALTYGGNGHVGTLGDDRTAILASGTGFADALAAGPVAAYMHFPLLLTPPDLAHPRVDHALAELAIDRILIIGGRAAVAPAVEQYYRDRGYAVDRIAGPNRMATSTEVARFARDRLGWSMDLQLLARSDAFPDALVGSVHSAERTAPILLTSRPDVLAAETAAFLAASCPAVDAVRALGGTAAISIQTLDRAVTTAASCQHRPRSEQDFGVAPQEVVTREPGTTQDVTVLARYDNEPFTGPVDIALFPCAAVEATASPVHFADVDGDRLADSIGHTDTDAARIVSVNGEPFDATILRRAHPTEQGVLTFDVHSDAPDCAVPVVFDDTNANGFLDVDEAGHAMEPFGVAAVRWEG